MPWSALPPELDHWQAWIGKDHDRVWYTKWVKYVKGWFAFSARAKERWAQWRSVPRFICGINDGSPWRMENIGDLTYTSRVQYWSRWHLQLQWPLMIAGHRYWRKEDVPVEPVRPEDLGLKKMIYFYGPIHFDKDAVFWILSFFLGGQWK